MGYGRFSGTSPKASGDWVEDTGTLTNGTYSDVTTTKITGAGDNDLTAQVTVSDTNGTSTFSTVALPNETGTMYQIGDRIKLTGLLAAGCTGANDDGEFTVKGLNYSNFNYPSDATATESITIPKASGTLMLNLSDDTTPQLSGDLNLTGNNIVGAGNILLTPSLETSTLLKVTYSSSGGSTARLDTTNTHASGVASWRITSDSGIYNNYDDARSIMKDEDDMASKSNRHLASQQSIWAYVNPVSYTHLTLPTKA